MSDPGLIVLTPIYGLEPAMEEIARFYRPRGFVITVPDLFARTAPGPLSRKTDRAAALRRKETTDPALVLQEVAGAIDAVRANPDCNGRVGVVGYCFGGRYAFLAASDLPVDAAVGVHPTEIGASLNPARKVRAPLQLHFGSDDEFVPTAEVETIARALVGNPFVEIFTYPGARHSFAVPGTPAYDAAADALARERILAFLKEKLSS